MRIFLFTIATLLFLPQAAAIAQTAMSKEQANNYYASCKAKQDPRMSTPAQDAFCACTSVKMMEAMSVEDVQTMAGNDQAGRNALNKMLIDVYAPCMSYPVEELVGAKCYNDPKLGALGLKKSKEKICDCVGQKTAAWFVDEGRDLMRNVLAQNPNIFDPIDPVMESAAFKSQSYENMMHCMKGTP